MRDGECPASSGVRDTAKHTHLFPFPSKIQIQLNPGVLHDWREGWGVARRIADRALERDVDVTISMTLSGSLPTSYQVPLTYRYLYLAQGHPQHTMCLTHTACKPVVSSLCVLPTAVAVSLYSWLVSTCKKLAWLCRIRRNHTNLSIQHHPRESKWEAVNTQYGFEGLREGMKS